MHRRMHNSDFNILLRSVHLSPKLQIPKTLKNIQKIKCYLYNTSFYGFLGFVVWEISGHFGGVYQSRYCASDGAFLFSFVYVMYLNFASYLCGKQIKSKLGEYDYFHLCTLETARSQ